MISPVSIIEKKRDGKELSPQEIHWFIQSVIDETFSHYQASALLMAIYLNGMSPQETVELTRAMAETGFRFDFSSFRRPIADKHSTGGVGDKTSLIIAPVAASLPLKKNLIIPMMSGRGLGFSGGTLDKLESIPGLNVHCSEADAIRFLKKTGFVMMGQSPKIAPADRILYGLRDVTGTVECIPLIVSSILSKKIAEGTQRLVIDVKVGTGAFMKSKTQASALAKELVRVGHLLGLKINAYLTDMNEPLGYAVGNALELIEAFDVLSKRDTFGLKKLSNRLENLSVFLTARMANTSEQLVQKTLATSEPAQKFIEMINNQGGDSSILNHPLQLIKNTERTNILSAKKGILSAMDASQIGRQVITLGGGRLHAQDKIDHAVGFLIHKKIGDFVEKGDLLAELVHRSNQRSLAKTIAKECQQNWVIQSKLNRKQNLILSSY